jgi:hypothetical protein
MEFTNDDM